MAGLLHIADDVLERLNSFCRDHELVLQEALGAVATVPFADQIKWLVELGEVFHLVFRWCAHGVISHTDCGKGQLVQSPGWEDIWNLHQLWSIELQWILGQLWCQFFQLSKCCQGTTGDGGAAKLWLRADDIEPRRRIGVVVL